MTRESGPFVVQRHRATRLHYDLRLEIGGVLVSWAVPRGPSLDPTVRRLAVRVEDHDRGHLDFEGVVGRESGHSRDTIVWDRGHWYAEETKPDVEAAPAAGAMKVRLEGVKLRGAFVLLRTRRGGGRPADREWWLLIHRRDDDAVVGWNPEDFPRSVKSGLTNDELAGVQASS